MDNERLYGAFDKRFLKMWADAARRQRDVLVRPPIEEIWMDWLDYVRSIGAETISHPAVQTFGFKKVSFGYVSPDGGSFVVPDPHSLRNYEREDLYIHVDAELAAKILTVGLP